MIHAMNGALGGSGCNTHVNHLLDGSSRHHFNDLVEKEPHRSANLVVFYFILFFAVCFVLSNWKLKQIHVASCTMPTQGIC